MASIHIRSRLNGYDVIAVCSVFNGPGATDDHEMVILGVDATRRTGKYVTAIVDARPEEHIPTEWYWGHYYEDSVAATRDFFERTRLPHILARLEEHVPADLEEIR